MGKCKDCKSWEGPIPCDLPGDWGTCNEVQNQKSDKYICFTWFQQDFIGANFGCIHFERREKCSG